jgi:dTDP-4-dehydrorhamnose reductase
MLLSRADLDITDPQTLEQIIQELHPWAIVNAAGYVKIDDAEDNEECCMDSNHKGAATLAEICAKHPVKLLTFSTDQVFDGNKNTPYLESDKVNPLNVYGKSKALAEKSILETNRNALVIRTSSFFGPYDNFNFVTDTLNKLKEGIQVIAADDVCMSPTYIPDLVNESLDLLLDNEHGIFHITNHGKITWAELARKVAKYSGYDESLVIGKPLNELGLKARRPLYSPLKSEKGIKLPTLHNALQRYFEAVTTYQTSAIAV